MRYKIYVTNKGLVFDTDDIDQAMLEFRDHKALIVDDYGSWSGETVTLFEDGEILAEWDGH